MAEAIIVSVNADAVSNSGCIQCSTGATEISNLFLCYLRFLLLNSFHCSNAKIFFQSFFMLMTTQPFFFASSYRACVNVPTFVSGNLWAGP